MRTLLETPLKGICKGIHMSTVNFVESAVEKLGHGDGWGPLQLH